MSFINNDLNIFYLAGSGGFYLLHYMMLFGQHWCRFHHSAEFNQQLVETWCAKDHNHAQLLRLTEETYQQCRGASWPDYHSYFQNYPNVDPGAQRELENLHQQWAYNVGCYSSGFDLEFQMVLQHQWAVSHMQNWKLDEHWPVNDQTLSIQTQARAHKVYFTCNNVQQWLQWPGQRVVIYTDCDSMLSLSRAKQASIYQPGKNFDAAVLAQEIIKNSVDYCNKKVMNALMPAVAQADHVIYLQDLILNPENVLNMCVTDQHKIFTQHWLDLHDSDLLFQTGLKL